MKRAFFLCAALLLTIIAILCAARAASAEVAVNPPSWLHGKWVPDFGTAGMSNPVAGMMEIEVSDGKVSLMSGQMDLDMFARGGMELKETSEGDVYKLTFEVNVPGFSVPGMEFIFERQGDDGMKYTLMSGGKGSPMAYRKKEETVTAAAEKFDGTFPEPRDADAAAVSRIVADGLGRFKPYMSEDEIAFAYSIVPDSGEFLKDLPPEVADADDKLAFERLSAMMATTVLSQAQLAGMDPRILLPLALYTLEKFPEHPTVLNNAGAIFSALYDDEKAETLFAEAAAASPYDPVLLTNLANAYLDKGDYGNAERWARQAVAADDGYGPAWQVLTFVHLNNGGDPVAAETMIRSANYGFDGTVLLLFKDYVREIDEMIDKMEELQYADEDWAGARAKLKKFEYPLREELFDLLYKVVRNGLEPIFKEVDEPQAQLTIPGLSVPGDAEAAAKIDFSKKRKEWGQIVSEERKRMKALEKTLGDFDEVFNNDTEKDVNVSPGVYVYPERLYLKPVWAYRVLDSFYRFKYRKRKADFYLNGYEWDENYRKEEADALKKLKDGTEAKLKDKRDEIKRLDEARQEKYESIWRQIDALPKGSSEAQHRLLEELGDFTERTWGKKDDIRNIDIPKIEIEGAEKRIELYAKKYSAWRPMYMQYFPELKIDLEEFYLKAGGMLAFMPDADIFNYLAADNLATIYEMLLEGFQPLEEQIYDYRRRRGEERSRIRELQKKMNEYIKKKGGKGGDDPGDNSAPPVLEPLDFDVDQDSQPEPTNDELYFGAKEVLMLCKAYPDVGINVLYILSLNASCHDGVYRFEYSTPLTLQSYTHDLKANRAFTVSAAGYSEYAAFGLKAAKKIIPDSLWQTFREGLNVYGGVYIPDSGIVEAGYEGEYTVRSQISNAVLDRGYYKKDSLDLSGPLQTGGSKLLRTLRKVKDIAKWSPISPGTTLLEASEETMRSYKTGVTKQTKTVTALGGYAVFNFDDDKSGNK